VAPSRLGDVPLKTIQFKYGIVVMIALALLRLGIGWHFYKEGAKKFADKDFSAKSFLEISHGPLAGVYRDMMVADADGSARLDPDITTVAWEDYLDDVIVHYDFDEAQEKKAEAVWNNYVQRFHMFLVANDKDIEKYRMELERLKELRKYPAREVEFNTKRLTAKEREVRGKLNTLMTGVEELWFDYQNALNDVATEEQRDEWGTLGIPDAAPMWLMNTAVKWTVILVGVFLLLGLFTRFWSVVGVGFLCSVITSQFPGTFLAEPTYYQVIELFALLVLIATNAGRFAGLDYFVDYLFQQFCCRPKQGTQEDESD